MTDPLLTTLLRPPGVPAPHPARPPAVLGLLIVIVLIAGVLSAVTYSGGPSHPHPSQWDPRVTDLAAYVETERGLTFDHPVFVDFLTAAEYTKQTTTDDAAIDKSSRSELARQGAQLRALGLASGKVDLFAAYNSVSDAGTLAFYDPTVQRIRVRGKTLTVGLRVTLVHELTHVLQDQHFNLERLYDVDLDSSASTAFRALAEGDALRVEEAYSTKKLTEDEKTAYSQEHDSQVQESAAATGDVPPFITASFSVPYLLGQPFVAMLANKGGNTAVDGAFKHPPTTEEHLFDPASYLNGEKATKVDLRLAKNTTIRDEGPFGSPSWYLLLAERIDPQVSFDATLGWAGDAYATFERGGRSCVRAAFVGDGSQDEKEMTAALKDWAAHMPGAMAKAIAVDGHPGFEACDPGDAVDMGLSGRASSALYVPSIWGYLIADAATQLDGDGARCYAHEVVRTLTYQQMTDPSGAAFSGDPFQARLTKAFDTCTSR